MPMRTIGNAFLALALLSSVCSAQTFWNGTRPGMTKRQVRSLFGADLNVEQTRSEPGYPGYTAYTMSREFCGGVFQVGFVFQANADRLISVMLVTGNHNTGGRIGDCVVRHYMAEFGQPVAAQDSELGITRMFVQGQTCVEVTTGRETDLVEVRYRTKAGST